MLAPQTHNLLMPQTSQEGASAGTLGSAWGRCRRRALGDKGTSWKCSERWKAGLEVEEDLDQSLTVEAEASASPASCSHRTGLGDRPRPAET